MFPPPPSRDVSMHKSPTLSWRVPHYCPGTQGLGIQMKGALCPIYLTTIGLTKQNNNESNTYWRVAVTNCNKTFINFCTQTYQHLQTWRRLTATLWTNPCKHTPHSATLLNKTLTQAISILSSPQTNFAYDLNMTLGQHVLPPHFIKAMFIIFEYR